MVTLLCPTTAFTCRDGCKERDVAENRHAGPVKCNAWFGGASTVFLQLNKILDRKSVGSPAFTPRDHHPQAQLVHQRPVGGKTDHDASRLRPILPQWRGHSLAHVQLHATVVLQLALG